MSASGPTRRARGPSIGERLSRLPAAARVEGEVRVAAAEFVDSVAKAKLRAAAARYKVEDEFRQTAARIKLRVGTAREKLGDEARFIKSWLDDPRRTGAVTPSSPALAKRMASYVDPDVPGPVIEIGPGDQITFPALQRALDMTAGNLSTHLRRLEEADYVTVTKSFTGRTPSTSVALTARGRFAFEDYTRTLTAILEGGTA